MSRDSEVEDKLRNCCWGGWVLSTKHFLVQHRTSGAGLPFCGWILNLSYVPALAPKTNLIQFSWLKVGMHYLPVSTFQQMNWGPGNGETSDSDTNTRICHYCYHCHQHNKDRQLSHLESSSSDSAGSTSDTSSTLDALGTLQANVTSWPFDTSRTLWTNWSQTSAWSRWSDWSSKS